jgi:hypothetical protein
VALKGFVEEGLAAGDIIVLISLDVKGAFDAAWWPSILNGLKTYNCPQNLCNLSKSYFSQRSAVISSNNISIQRIVTKGTTQGPCFGTGYWNIQYNSPLNLQFTKRSKAVAFADGLILAIRSETIRAVENISNIEMSKLTVWLNNNKISFNEEKFKVMVISRRKRKENKGINICLNNNLYNR